MLTNSTYKLRLIISCFCAVILIACESHEKQADDAFEQVKEDKKEAVKNGTYEELSQQPIIQDSVVPEPTVKEPIKTEVVTKTINQDEWSKFRAETEKKILANEIKIKAIKAIPGTSAALLEELSTKEKEYNDLRRKLDEYSEEMKESLGKFRAKMNHEVNETSIDLNDLTIKLKK